MKNKRKFVEAAKILVIVLIFLFSTYEKYKVYDKAGGDITVFRKAVTDLLSGANPYYEAVASFTQPEKGLDHGYAYFPTLMYMYTPLYLVHLNFDIPLQRVWKTLTLITDYVIAAILIKMFYKKDYFAAALASFFWLYNPYIFIRHEYSYNDSMGILSMVLALYFMETKSAVSGFWYAVSVSFKTFPVVLFPLFMLKTKNRVRFLAAGFAFALLISLPFITSIKDIKTYVRGTVLIHGERDPQGRPLLIFVQYYTHLPLFNLAHITLYSIASMLSGWVATLYLYFKKITRNKYVLSMISFLGFYILTPVFNRTYLLWFIPVYILGMYELLAKRNKWAFYVSVVLFYVLYSWYLSIWTKGVQVSGTNISL